MEGQLLTFRAYCKREFSGDQISLKDITAFFIKSGFKDLLSEISKVLKLILVLPASNAECERAFSALKRVKDYLSSTMGQARLNHLMLLNLHKEKAKSLSLVDVANEFASRNDRRMNDFGDKKFA